MLIGVLLLWWFALLNPLLFLLRESVGLCCGTRFVTQSANGDWTFEVPIHFQLSGENMSSIDFDLARSDAGAFTFGLPVFWALILAAPGVRRSGRPLIIGTLLMWALEVVLLLVFAEIFAHKTVAQMTGSQDSFGAWLERSSEYLVVSVIPFVTPFVVAICMHGELRGLIFQLPKKDDSRSRSTEKVRRPRKRR